jgi:hypothetical protein
MLPSATASSFLSSVVNVSVLKGAILIYLFISLSADDLEIGGVPRLIFTESDPELKERTVGRFLALFPFFIALTWAAGVLTKVDRIVEDMRPAWLETFNNKTRKLDNGWFAVKLPAGGDIPWEEARKQEREFFRDNEPWKSIRREDRNRLGSEQLTQYISKLLSNLVAARFVYNWCNLSYELTSMLGFRGFHKTLQKSSTSVTRISSVYRFILNGMPMIPFSLSSTDSLRTSPPTSKEFLRNLSLLKSDWFIKSKSCTTP